MVVAEKHELRHIHGKQEDGLQENHKGLFMGMEEKAKGKAKTAKMDMHNLSIEKLCLII